jgi:hypothetical protein
MGLSLEQIAEVLSLPVDVVRTVHTELRSIVVNWKAGGDGEAGGEKVSSLNATSYQ